LRSGTALEKGVGMLARLLALVTLLTVLATSPPAHAGGDAAVTEDEVLYS
jgi:hypothetical protein